MRYYVMNTEEMGRGIFAETDLKKGDLVCYSELLVLNVYDTGTIDQTDLKYYVYKFDEKRDCIGLGDSSLFNHSDDANVGFELVSINGRSLLRHFMLKDTKKDEQLFINYEQDVKVDISKYTVNLV